MIFFPFLNLYFYSSYKIIFFSKKSKVDDLDIKMLVTVVEGNPKAPFAITITPRCRGGCYSIPWIAPLYPWSLSYNAECWARRHQVPFFEPLVWLNHGLNSGLPDHWRTLYSWLGSKDIIKRDIFRIHDFYKIINLKYNCY